MTRKSWIAGIATALAMSIPAGALAQSVEDFYSGRDVKIIIGAGLGGSYGLYSQLAAKYIGKYIPGNPTVIVESMPGAGGLKALNYTYDAAPRDGSVLTIAHAEVLFETLLGDNTRFNAADYNWIGRLADVDFTIVASKESGITSLEDAREQSVAAGATGLRSVTAIGPQLFNHFAGTQFDIVAGYDGTSAIFLAVEQGEVDAVATSWPTLRIIHGDKLDAGDLVPIGSVAIERLSALPDVPAITEFADSPAAETFLNIYGSGGMIGRSLATPPEVPEERVAALREAYGQMIEDPEFLAEIEERNIILNPMPGEELQSRIDEFMATPPDQIEAAKELFQEIIDEINS